MPSLVGSCVAVVVVLLAVLNGVCSQVDSCGAGGVVFLPFPFNDSSFQCRPVWNNFILRYSHNQDNTLSIILSALYASGWVGIGFSNDGMMVGSSAMVGWIDKTGKAKIKQYYLRGQSSSQVIVNKGRLQETSIAPAIVLYGVNIYMAFQLKFSAPITRQSLLLAFSSVTPSYNQLTQHDDKTSISFDFSAGTTLNSSFPHQLKRNHGLLAIFGWGVLIPVGAIIARYCRNWDPLWFYLHVVVQFVGFIIGFAGIIAGISLYDRLHFDVPVHKAVGIIVLTLGCLQVIAFFIRPDKDSKIRKYWNWYHRWVGRLAIFLAAVNISLGIQIGNAGSSWKMGYGAVLAFILILVSILEAIMWTQLSQKTITSEN